MSENPGMEDGYRALSYLLAGLALYGGLGWLTDQWLGTRFLMPIGLIVGLALGVFLTSRHFGANERRDAASQAETQPKESG